MESTSTVGKWELSPENLTNPQAAALLETILTCMRAQEDFKNLSRWRRFFFNVRGQGLSFLHRVQDNLTLEWSKLMKKCDHASVTPLSKEADVWVCKACGCPSEVVDYPL